MAKQYSVRDWVRNNAADNAEVAKILVEHPLWSRKHARELLARRRFAKALSPKPQPTRRLSAG